MFKKQELMLDGYFVLKNKEEGIEEILSSSKRNYSIEITKAVRDTKIDELSIKKR